MTRPKSEAFDARLRAMLTWFAREYGNRPQPMPSNDAIATRLGIPKLQTLSYLLRTAREEGLLEITMAPAGPKRTVLVLPAGHEMAAGGPRGRAGALASEPLSVVADGYAAANDFQSWLSAAAPGERRVYFHGHLAEARGKPPERRGPVLNAMLHDAVEAAVAAERGLVHLVSRRVADGTEYIAIRARSAS